MCALHTLDACCIRPKCAQGMMYMHAFMSQVNFSTGCRQQAVVTGIATLVGVQQLAAIQWPSVVVHMLGADLPRRSSIRYQRTVAITHTKGMAYSRTMLTNIAKCASFGGVAVIVSGTLKTAC